MIYTLRNRTADATRHIDVTTDTAARTAAMDLSRELGGLPVRVTDDRGRVVADEFDAADEPRAIQAETATPPVAPEGFTLAVFEDVALGMIRAGHGRTDLIAACNRASNRRTQEVAAATYGRQA